MASVDHNTTLLLLIGILCLSHLTQATAVRHIATTHTGGLSIALDPATHTSLLIDRMYITGSLTISSTAPTTAFSGFTFVIRQSTVVQGITIDSMSFNSHSNISITGNTMTDNTDGSLYFGIRQSPGVGTFEVEDSTILIDSNSLAVGMYFALPNIASTSKSWFTARRSSLRITRNSLVLGGSGQLGLTIQDGTGCTLIFENSALVIESNHMETGSDVRLFSNNDVTFTDSTLSISFNNFPGRDVFIGRMYTSGFSHAMVLDGVTANIEGNTAASIRFLYCWSTGGLPTCGYTITGSSVINIHGHSPTPVWVAMNEAGSASTVTITGGSELNVYDNAIGGDMYAFGTIQFNAATQASHTISGGSKVSFFRNSASVKIWLHYAQIGSASLTISGQGSLFDVYDNSCQILYFGRAQGGTITLSAQDQSEIMIRENSPTSLTIITESSSGGTSTVSFSSRSSIKVLQNPVTQDLAFGVLAATITAESSSDIIIAGNQLNTGSYTFFRGLPSKTLALTVTSSSVLRIDGNKLNGNGDFKLFPADGGSSVLSASFTKSSTLEVVGNVLSTTGTKDFLVGEAKTGGSVTLALTRSTAKFWRNQGEGWFVFIARSGSSSTLTVSSSSIFSISDNSLDRDLSFMHADLGTCTVTTESASRTEVARNFLPGGLSVGFASGAVSLNTLKAGIMEALQNTLGAAYNLGLTSGGGTFTENLSSGGRHKL